MTHFEYISVAVAIVLSLAVVRLLDAVPHIATPGRRYWVLTVWVGFLVMWSAFFWWVSWFYHAEREEFTFGPFLLIVMPAGFLYLGASTLVTNAPSQVESWSQHFWTVRKRFFGYLIAFTLSLLLESLALQMAPLLSVTRPLPLVLGAILVTGFVSPSPRVHMVLAGLVSIFALALMVLVIGGGLQADLDSQ